MSAYIRLPGLLIAAIMTCAGCSDSSDSNPEVEDPYLPIAQARVELPPEQGRFFLQLARFDIGELGYQATEYFFSGAASAFTNVEELTSIGEWLVEPGETANYKTRLVVARPVNDADFSGTVLVEWLNVTSGFDNGPSWNTGRTNIIREGHAWIGVSAQKAGIEGTDFALIPLHLKAVNPERYESLQHPGDSFSYDIFSQARQLLRSSEGIDILDGLQPQTVVAIGESQSASRLATYVNAIHPLYNPFDGYLIHSRYKGAQPLAQEPQPRIPTPEGVLTREDLNAPVLVFATETDVLDLDYVSDRQDDSAMFRLWEVAGTAHADNYTAVTGFRDKGTDPVFAVVVENKVVPPGVITCDEPLNAGPHPWVFNAALSALLRWVSEGIAPPSADRLAVADDGSDFQRDQAGNVLSGIRTPYVDAPAAVLSGRAGGGSAFCSLFGTTALFDASTMASRYVDRQGYIQAVSEATDVAVDAGHLLPVDAERIKAAAGLQWDALEM